MPTKKELQERLEQLKETNETLNKVINHLNKHVAHLECLLEENDIDPKFYEEESDSSFIVSDDDYENCSRK